MNYLTVSKTKQDTCSIIKFILHINVIEHPTCSWLSVVRTENCNGQLPKTSVGHVPAVFGHLSFVGCLSASCHMWPVSSFSVAYW